MQDGCIRNVCTSAVTRQEIHKILTGIEERKEGRSESAFSYVTPNYFCILQNIRKKAGDC